MPDKRLLPSDSPVRYWKWVLRLLDQLRHRDDKNVTVAIWKAPLHASSMIFKRLYAGPEMCSVCPLAAQCHLGFQLLHTYKPTCFQLAVTAQTLTISPEKQFKFSVLSWWRNILFLAMLENIPIFYHAFRISKQRGLPIPYISYTESAINSLLIIIVVIC